jgi:hypothetical protein
MAPARSAVLSEARGAESKGQDDAGLRRADRAAADDAAASDHVVAIEWVPVGEVGERIVVRVVREPLLAYLRGSLVKRYAGFEQAGITIEWPPDSR